tara:strand:- start:1781 stop:2989 length:1209 start_codon:yes stop_codon:yes gene_type:complete
MKLNSIENSNSTKISDKNWPWWPLFPLYPYGKKNTIFREIIPNQIWSFEQLQGIYYVAVPIRLTVVKVSGGLMLFNPLPPTAELMKNLLELQNQHGSVIDIVLPTASGLEHKISLPAMARAFPKANIWVCPGQWSFPINLPLSFIGIPSSRTKVLFNDGLPNEEQCEWISLGPIDIGLGRFQEVACYHKISKSLLVTDALVGIDIKPPELFDLDPTPLLFHSRERGDEPLIDNEKARLKGWRRLVLFASFLKPVKLSIPSLKKILGCSFKEGLRNSKAHFGIYPFSWDFDWESSADDLIGSRDPLIQVPPVLERLVFPRARETFVDWLRKISSKKDIKWVISSHYSAPLSFSKDDIERLIKNISNNNNWASSEGNWKFLDWLDKKLLKLGVVPKDPLKSFRN